MKCMMLTKKHRLCFLSVLTTFLFGCGVSNPPAEHVTFSASTKQTLRDDRSILVITINVEFLDNQSRFANSVFRVSVNSINDLSPANANHTLVIDKSGKGSLEIVYRSKAKFWEDFNGQTLTYNFHGNNCNFSVDHELGF